MYFKFFSYTKSKLRFPEKFPYFQAQSVTREEIRLSTETFSTGVKRASSTRAVHFGRELRRRRRKRRSSAAAPLLIARNPCGSLGSAVRFRGLSTAAVYSRSFHSLCTIRKSFVLWRREGGREKRREIKVPSCVLLIVHSAISDWRVPELFCRERSAFSLDWRTRRRGS